MSTILACPLHCRAPQSRSITIGEYSNLSHTFRWRSRFEAFGKSGIRHRNLWDSPLSRSLEPVFEETGGPLPSGPVLVFSPAVQSCAYRRGSKPGALSARFGLARQSRRRRFPATTAMGPCTDMAKRVSTVHI